jgi:hypothetical protein
MPKKPRQTESELRNAVIDRLIAARLSESRSAQEARLEQWRTIGARKNTPASSAPKLVARKTI